MIRLKQLAEHATAVQGRKDYQRGYFDGINLLNPPNPDDLSFDYWEGYGQGARDEYMTRDCYPDAIIN